MPSLLVRARLNNQWYLVNDYYDDYSRLAVEEIKLFATQALALEYVKLRGIEPVHLYDLVRDPERECLYTIVPVQME